MLASRRSGLRLLALGAVVVATAVVARTPAVADHDVPAETVTLVGSLQSELGCGEDWSPSCEATTGTVPEVGPWSITVEVPAGTWEWKVALDGTWDRPSYPSANVPLVLGGPTRLTFSYDDTSHRVAVAPADPPEGVTDADRQLAGTSLRADLTRERFYFVMADRFENGDTANDTGGIAGGGLDHGFDPTHKGFYHGGDLAGLIDRLDYIEALGTTAIWMTPMFKNRPVQGADPFISAGYHGYWITDFTQIDPHMGTNAELRQLVDEAHARGIKVFFDIITNHTADVIDYTEGPENNYAYIDKATAPYLDASGNPFDDRAVAGSPDFPPLHPIVSFPYTPVFPTVADETVKVPDWLNDPIYYHNRGNTTFIGEDSEYGDFFGLDDLFTEHPDVVDGMTEIYKTWVGFGIDGFRIDTVKHVNMEFWKVFAPAIAQRAEDLGNDDFFAFGEVFDANPAFMSRYTTEAGLQATLDFGFQARARGFAEGGATANLRDLFADDDYYTDTDSNAYSLPTFLGNHDMGRIGRFITDANAGATDGELLARDQLAHSLMYLSRGQPVVYYGDEQGFVGDPGGDQNARQDMFPSQVASYNDDDLIATDATTADENFDQEHPLYQHLAALSALRGTHPALADGAQIHRYASANAGVYAFSRIDATDQREYIVAANNSETAQTVSFRTLSEHGTFRGLWPAGTGDIASDGEGRVTVTVPAMSALVWRATSDVKPQQHAPAMFFRTPGPGATVGGRAEIGVAVPADGFNQVTIAWRPAGMDEWTALGTDDNAPHRVFHDVRGLARGTLVEYRAVLRDHSGNLSVAQTYATVGDPPPPGGGGGGGGGPVTQPPAVSVPGSLNTEMGCAGDWDPACDQAQLTLDSTRNDQIWKGTFDLPAGDYEFKVAINRGWDENYGAGGAPNGANISFTHPGGPVTFYYDHGTHWVTNDVISEIITAPGSAQSELGCRPGDWLPDCMRPWLQDPDADGVWTWSTTEIPAGSYEVKVTHGLSWDENYGAGGAPNGSNIGYTVPADGARVTFSYVLASHVLTVTTARGLPDIKPQKAHWLERGLIAWDLPPEASGWNFRLHTSPTGGLVVDEEAILGGPSFPLTLEPGGLPPELAEQWPHLATYDALRVSRRAVRIVDQLVTGQLAIAAYDDLGRLVDATGVQIPGVLDDVYEDAVDRQLGVTWNAGTPTLTLWAPTAKDVDLLVRLPGETADTRVEMPGAADGVWSVTGTPDWKGASYLFDVDVYVPAEDEVVTNTVTDPYALALTTDSARSVIVDLGDPALRPAGWSSLAKPALAQPEDSTIYELHVRDFSIGDESVPAAHRGGYLAFTDAGSVGMQQLQRLADSGLNTVHLLPVFDIATIPERRAAQATPACDLESFGPASEEQQDCVTAVVPTDGFNWGYDPWHYTTPEGSYATDPEGPGRTLEFRQMVAALNGAGLRVVMDVVYNHTTQSGQGPKSVLDRIVPGYYQRLSATGAVETSTCCANTASEHQMMEKLMVDSIVTWAREYKVDGFRFDLMGHHSLANMLAVRDALDELTLERDGVDGRRIYVYGEGWDFGEVANGARFTQARQVELAGTGIGSFTDRLRDAVRGGGPFDADPRIQGFATGLFTAPNGAAVNGAPEQQLARLLLYHDQIKVGLAGNLRDYELVDRNGNTVTGAEVDYNGQPAGYAGDPSETITYVDAHDNETLFDVVQYKLPQATSMLDRVRMNTVALATTALSQGPSFWHAGADLLRSKSLDRNSYDSGDWFNRIDWAAEESTWGSGLPPETDNGSKWDFMRPLLSDPALEPQPADLDRATTAAAELLRIRFSSPLFRLGTASKIQQRVDFPIGGPDQTPGVITMTIDDRGGGDLDPQWEGIVVVFNATPGSQTQTVPALAGRSYSLHPVQAAGADPTVKTSTYDPASGAFTVPGRTVAVFTTT